MTEEKKNIKGKVSLYEYLNLHKDGEIDSLNGYDHNEFLHLCRLGFVTRGVDARSHKRYKVTALGEKQIKMICTREKLSPALDSVLSILG